MSLLSESGRIPECIIVAISNNPETRGRCFSDLGFKLIDSKCPLNQVIELMTENFLFYKSYKNTLGTIIRKTHI